LGVIAQIIFWSYVAPVVGANSIQNTKIEPIPCLNETIDVKGRGCLKYDEDIKGCHPINCWKWNKIKGQCEEDGKPYLPALVLQSIPVTGAFGSGFGNMGRWDIFGTYLLVIFGGACLICCVTAVTSQSEETEEVAAAKICCIYGCGCIWSIAIFVMWVWGISVIANKGVNAPWTDYLGNSIMCPLVN
jgi:hypothetical protein